ncbi:MAG: cache domain-containing protein, partial [Pseudomonadota bacterium]
MTLPAPSERTRRRRPGVGALVALALLVGVTALVTAVGAWVESRELAALSEATRQRLEVHALSLGNAVARFEYLPSTVALNPELALLAKRPDDAALADGVNRYLEQVNRQAGSTALYLMDRDGRTLATSNWQTSESYLGLNFGFRPYFLDAVAGGFGRFYGVGVTTGRPGYFMATPVHNGHQVIAVVAVKVNLDELEASWSDAVDQVAVFDGNGVAFLSGEPAWRLHARDRLSDEQL